VAVTQSPRQSGDLAGGPADSDGNDLPEQMRVRHAKRLELLDSGKEAYPVSVAKTHGLADIRQQFGHLGPEETSGLVAGVTGRVMFLRNTGKLCFATLRDGDGSELQAMLSLANVGEESLGRWKAIVDIGDHVYVRGEIVASRRGELSVMATDWEVAAKALRPLPVAHKDLNEETRVRQRYVDLIMNPAAREMARMRPRVVAALRSTFEGWGFLEVETPMLQTLQGGAAARPFVTHINAFDIDVFLRIAPELFLKRAVVGGLGKVFEINRNFRNEGADSSHSPEFAMLEFYAEYHDYRDMARLTRELIQAAAMAAHGTLTFTHVDGTTKDFSGEWDEVTLFGSLSAAIDEVISPETPLSRLRELAAEAGLVAKPHWVHGKYVEELFEHHVVATFERPTFVYDYPVDTSPLTRDHRATVGLVEKWDLYIDGFEQATGYSELVDPVIQRERLTAQADLASQGDVEAMALDEDFLRALEYGMPPSGGVGIGIDRLLMSLTGLGIRDTILFPLVKPERQ
jgi:lysyl-tRNA synthetase, class II